MNKMKRPPLIWTANIKGESEKLKFEQHVNDVLEYPCIQRLKTIIKQAIKANDRAKYDFNTPNWEHRQAFLLGMDKAYGKILSIISYKDNNEDNLNNE